MPVTYLNTRWGGSSENPSLAALHGALAELEKKDPEHPDCWLSDDQGWTIAAHENGKIVLENLENGEGPWHLFPPRKDFVVALWQSLQKGDLEAVKQNQWLEGYGS